MGFSGRVFLRLQPGRFFAAGMAVGNCTLRASRLKINLANQNGCACGGLQWKGTTSQNDKDQALAGIKSMRQRSRDQEYLA